MLDVPTLDEEDIFLVVEFPGRVLDCCLSIIERIVGIIFVQACSSFLVGMHVVIHSVSEVIYFLLDLRAKGFFSLTSSKSPGQVVSFSL